MQFDAKKIVPSFIFAVLTLFSVSAFAKNFSVQIKSISYDPKSIDIKVGDSVQWKNTSLTDHSSSSYENEKNKFDTGMIKPGKTSEKIDFKIAGTYTYHCQVHGKTMTGKINVNP